MMKGLTIALALAALKGVYGHTIFTQLNGNPVGYGVRVPSYDGPITDVSSNYIACNGGPNPTTPSDKKITVAAGSTAKLTWRHTLTSGPNDVVDSSHKGPVQAYLKKVSNALTDPGYGSGWYKIAEDGYSGGSWGVERLIANAGVQTITIPSCIAPGDYLLRGELIALHGAGSSGGAQFYQECAQITVTGGTGTKTPSTVSLPGAYKANDPGILINIYYPPINSYEAPGPEVFKC